MGAFCPWSSRLHAKEHISSLPRLLLPLYRDSSGLSQSAGAFTLQGSRPLCRAGSTVTAS